MKTSKFLAGAIAICILAVSCNKVSYKKTPGGMTYQLFAGKDTQHIYAGNIMKLNIKTVIRTGEKDSVYFTTEGRMPVFLPVPGTSTPYDLSELWTKLKVGDSLVATQMMDTFIKRNPELIQRFKAGDRILNYVKVLAVYTSDSAANADNMKMQNEWMKNEEATIVKYLADKKINAQKTPSGAYVEMITPGTGPLVDSGKYVSVNYTGRTFSGVKFDSNTDSTFQHVTPLSFQVNTGAMIKGFDEAMRFMNVGCETRVYVPSMLGYGPNPPQGSPIKPFESLIFDLKLVGISDAPARNQVPNTPHGQPGGVQ